MKRFFRTLAVVMTATIASHTSLSAVAQPAAESLPSAQLEASYKERIQPLLKRYCLECHSATKQEGQLDLERFLTAKEVRQDARPWQSLVERVGSGEMPPEDSKQPTAEERKTLVEWTRSLLDDEARARSGDPGKRPLRRLSNAEYNYTIRDLTGVDLQPAREFPADGAAGEGFTNAAEALAMSPALMSKYLNAAKEISAHAVLLPDGFRFSKSKTTRDWVDESVAQLRAFYASILSDGKMFSAPTVDQRRAGTDVVKGPFSGDGRLPLPPYLALLIKHREALSQQRTTIDQLAAETSLSPKYLAIVWQAMTSDDGSFLLAPLRARFQHAKESDAASLADVILVRGRPLWEFVPIGSYRRGYGPRALERSPTVLAGRSFRVETKTEPGASETTLYLQARPVVGGPREFVVWERPRFEAPNEAPLMLADYEKYGAQYEIDLAALFASTGVYLNASLEAAHHQQLSTEAAAKKYGIDAGWLQRWRDVLAVTPLAPGETTPPPGRDVARVELELLDDNAPLNRDFPTVAGWRKKGTDLPLVAGNSSGETLQIPGRIGGHRTAVHPTPGEFVAVAWQAPAAATIRVVAKIAHAHPSCGNGVAWRLELQTPNRSAILADGAVDLGARAEAPPQTLSVKKGDVVFLAVDARDANHICDLTEIEFLVSELDGAKRSFDFNADAADRIATANPLADKSGLPGLWSFVRGPSSARKSPSQSPEDANTLLARWRRAAADPAKRDEAVQLGDALQTLLTGPRPSARDPKRVVYDELAAIDGPLLKDVDLGKLAPRRARDPQYALPKSRFGTSPEGEPIDPASFVAAVGETIALRLPTELLRGRTFVADARLGANSSDAVVQFQIASSDQPQVELDQPFAAALNSDAHGRLLTTLGDFRRIFPPYVCYPYILPLDEVVCLKTFHREDEPLIRLFLDDAQTEHLERLWAEHRFISRFPLVENVALPQFIGFVTQDQPKELLAYYEGFREPFNTRAAEFERDFDAASERQLDQLAEFAARAYRRPPDAHIRKDLKSLYTGLRGNGLSHEQAFRDVLARVLVSPAFLLHIETAPRGVEPGPIDDWALASRLSYFLWSSLPDDELRTLAASGTLHEPEVLAAQTQRMLADPRARALAVEFGTQWIHVRGFDEFKEKNETLFPTFDQTLKNAIYEESILFFQDHFQHDRSLRQILDADYTYLNETLAKHYAIPNVVGSEWRRVDGVKSFGRGGILGLASVQSRQAGASRTSPVLRGNWVVETLLGEKLPPPPPNVPILPDEENSSAGLTTRQLVEKHVKQAECAACHQRIDPLGFALEHYDAIGRRRETDAAGAALDAHAQLKDGTEFDGIDGLRTYLLTKKRDVIERLFCRRLLGYALGRSVELSDTVLLDAILKDAQANDGRVSRIVQSIVQSPQFRMIRGADHVESH